MVYQNIDHINHHDNTSQLTYEQSILKPHLPEVKWMPDDEDLMVEVSYFLRKDIEKAYIEAWHLANASIEYRNPEGLKDRYTSEMIEKIKSNNISKYGRTKRKDISHRLRLTFLSTDKNFVTFTDTKALVIRQFIVSNKKGESITQHIQYENQQVIMVFQDGKWKVKEMIQTATSPHPALREQPILSHEIALISGLNYYPTDTPWLDFWPNFSEKSTSDDFKKIKGLGMNTIRIFIPYEIFGGNHIDHNHLINLNKLMDIADTYELKVIITLFDFPSGYSLDQYLDHDLHLFRIVESVKNHPALLAWDIKNEPDLDFHIHGKDRVTAWLSFMTNRLHEYDINHPVTIGWSTPDIAYHLENQVDFISFHYYREVDKLPSKLAILKDRTNKPILMEEYGSSSYSSFWYPGSQNICQQSNYNNLIKTSAEENGVTANLLWCYSDYPNELDQIFGKKPWIYKPQTSFGLFDIHGNMKYTLNGKIQECYSFNPFVPTLLLFLFACGFLLYFLFSFALGRYLPNI